MHPSKRHILIILDGFGITSDASVSAIHAARTPFLDGLFSRYPNGTLVASGKAVGLPRGQMGNSEVGHMNLGAGRTVNQEITRIDLAIEDQSFFVNEALLSAARRVAASGKRLHLMGLFSDGGVHSHLDHLLALLRLAGQEGLTDAQVCVHAFTDGRDTAPDGGLRYVKEFVRKAPDCGPGRLVSIVGRYYAMDRDQRWDRVERAYRLLLQEGDPVFGDPVKAMEHAYAEGTTDEFVAPRRIDYGDGENTRIRPGDVVVFFNFRADRGRQMVQALTGLKQAPPFPRISLPDLHLVTLTSYDNAFDLPVAFRSVDLSDTLGEVLARRGARQLRIAETEKYPHVTYFFSGGREAPFEGEDRILVPSPKVATYDLQPEMSAPELASRCMEALARKCYNFICLNFANPDMVGHTGVFKAAVLAVEAVDAQARRVIEAAQSCGYAITVLADHGNADRMKMPDGSPHTAHTTALVPHLVIRDGTAGPIRTGKLGDVAPTILRLMGEPVPEAMTGQVLVSL